MRVIVEILTGTLFYVEIKDDATVADLKKEIGFQERLPLDRLILLADDGCNSKSLLMAENGLSLRDYGVEDGSHVYLFFETVDDVSPHLLLPFQESGFQAHLIEFLCQQSEMNLENVHSTMSLH